MDTIGNAARVLRDAEQALRELLAKAATTGRYDDLLRLSDFARELSALATRAEDAVPLVADIATPVDGRAAIKVATETGANWPTGRPISKKRTYPKFLREGETIVKLAWSKASKAEYEHKAPKRVLAHLLAAFSALAATKRRITMNEVLPLTDPVSGSEIPAYQVYLCLAWFRSIGIVTQHGRQGYSLAKKDAIAVDSRVEECWRALAAR